MELKSVPLQIPEGCNIILGQSHFIKTAEDLYEIMVTSCPHAKFGIAFCEASGPCLIRVDGNDDSLKKTAAENARTLAAGVGEADLAQGSLFPPLRQIREISLAIAAAVAHHAYDTGLATEPLPEDVRAFIEGLRYDASYEDYA